MTLHPLESQGGSGRIPDPPPDVGSEVRTHPPPIFGRFKNIKKYFGAVCREVPKNLFHFDPLFFKIFGTSHRKIWSGRLQSRLGFGPCLAGPNFISISLEPIKAPPPFPFPSCLQYPFAHAACPVPVPSSSLRLHFTIPADCHPEVAAGGSVHRL